MCHWCVDDRLGLFMLLCLPKSPAMLNSEGLGRIRQGIQHARKPNVHARELNMQNLAGYHTYTHTPNPPTSITPINIAWLKFSAKFPMGLGIPPLNFEICWSQKPLKSTKLVGRLGAHTYTYIRVRVSPNLHRCTLIYTYIHIYIYIHTRTCTHIHIHTRMQTYEIKL